MNWAIVKMWIHGAVLAAGTAFTMSIEQIIQSGAMPKTDGITALSVGVLYLLKVVFMGSSNDPTPPAAGNAAKLIMLVAFISILSSCATWKSIKWSGNCTTGGCNICANIDSVKFVNLTEQQLLSTVKSALSNDLINNLSGTYGLSNLGMIGWTFSYSAGKVCLGATLNVQKTFGGAQQIPTTFVNKQKAVVNGMWKSLHK